jgi:hypothetical protein
MVALRHDVRSATSMGRMGAMSEAVAAFFVALDRIEARSRQPTISEDRILHLAWSMLSSPTPGLATEVLHTLALQDRNTVAAPHAPTAKSIVEWRNKLRKFLH